MLSATLPLARREQAAEEKEQEEERRAWILGYAGGSSDSSASGDSEVRIRLSACSRRRRSPASSLTNRLHS